VSWRDNSRPQGHSATAVELRWRGEHVVMTFWTEVDSTALPTSKDTGRGCRFFVKVTRKFTVDNSRKTRSNIHFETEMFDLVLLVLSAVNFRVTLMKNLWPLPMFCALGSTALSTVQNVVTTCSQHFDRQSIVQRCRLVCTITRIQLTGLVLVSVWTGS